MEQRSPTQTQTTPSFTPVSPGLLQRQCTSCGQNTAANGECSKKRQLLQRHSKNKTEYSQVPPIVHEVLQSPGQFLDKDTRNFIEPRFGRDFSQVRVHTDPKAAESARAVNALAYTVGKEIVFNVGQYAPTTIAGKQLLTHELVHVVQQNNTYTPDRHLSLSQDGDRYEQEAGAIVQSLSPRAIDATPSMQTTHLLPPGSLQVMREQAPTGGTAPIQRGEVEVCDARRRASMDMPTPSCCTTAMLRELNQQRANARPIISNALNALSRPQSVREQLQAHFLVNPNDSARLSIIRTQYQNMLNTISSDEVQFWCRDKSDPTCQSQTGQRRAASFNCSTTNLVSMFCGDYERSVAGGTFLSGENWLKTMIHEYAHLGCPSVGLILSAGNEFYIGRPGYPGPNADVAIKNADSYANFVIALNSGGGSGLPGWAIALLTLGGAGLLATGIGLAAHFG